MYVDMTLEVELLPGSSLTVELVIARTNKFSNKRSIMCATQVAAQNSKHFASTLDFC